MIRRPPHFAVNGYRLHVVFQIFTRSEHRELN